MTAAPPGRWRCDLVAARDKGLTIFWAHDLQAMFRWMRDTGANANEGATP